MKSKIKTVYVCQSCGTQSPRWMGKCPDCGAWNTMVEEQVEKSKDIGSAKRSGGMEPILLNEIQARDEDRFVTKIGELDRVLGGGIVPGSVVLIGGDPGIGKSTLVLQMLRQVSELRGKALYVTGEESPAQIKMRAQRLGVKAEHLYVLAETSLDEIIRAADGLEPQVLVVDSVQTVFTSELPSAPGSVGQVREVSGRLMIHAKKTGMPTFLIGHVTKDGAIAGPRVLEHIVDTVLYFEGDKGHSFRILRAVKNRFGSTNEIGVFEMKESGLAEVANPSEIFLAERPADATGSVVVSSLEGSRPILAELQALVAPSKLTMPRRTCIGVDYNRVSLLLAVLEKRVGMQLMGMDVFVNIVGGLKIDEPAVDLGIIAAVASSFRERPIAAQTVVMGEVGLAGEVRAISQAEARIKDAAKLGFKRCVLPALNVEKMDKASKNKMELLGVRSVDEAMERLF
ncbi:MAG: DNA repair protein RadA [Nitrospirae bacterium GWC2_56_14]|jgi:DNA repair protein RadA/Sms|nr:MAG: DNA repair protein RadA [Nitrospirae bacterium GWC2_56_14]